MLHICSLPLMPRTVMETRASHILTLMKNVSAAVPPAGFPPERHLKLDFSDIIEPRDGEVMPAPEHVEGILRFADCWHQQAPMVVHCYAGISRSTAAAFITACHLCPDRDENSFARAIRQASPTATPNIRLVAYADDILNRRGRMVRAIEAIGRGIDSLEGVPFSLPLGA